MCVCRACQTAVCANAQQYGIGQPVPIKSLSSQFDAKTALIWADGTNSSLGASSPTAAQIIEHITASFTPSQRAAVRQISDPANIPAQCPQNFNLFSSCFAAVAFYDIPGPSATNATSGGSGVGRSVNYTISADSGLQFIDVVNHKSDFEKRVLPLQWAIDQVRLAVILVQSTTLTSTLKAIIELQTGIPQQTPLEWPFNQETNEEQKKRIRLSTFSRCAGILILTYSANRLPQGHQVPACYCPVRFLPCTYIQDCRIRHIRIRAHLSIRFPAGSYRSSAFPISCLAA
jgi:ATP-binding cassette subfamily A (ABC1) protein 3